MYPVSGREVSFQHEGARHRFQYRDGAQIEQLGSEPLTFSYTIPMREGIARGPYKELFSKGLPILLRDCQDRSRDMLVDPVYGPFNCVPTSYRDSTDVNKRDGVDITVEFAVSLEPGDDAGPAVAPTTSSIFSEAGKLDAALRETSFEQVASEQGSNDLLTQLAGVGAQIEQQGRSVSAQLEGIALRAKTLDEQIDKTEDPSKWGLQQSARNVREAALRLVAKGANPGERIIRVSKNSAKTVVQICAEETVDLVEFIKLNPTLLASPIVPPNTPIKLPPRKRT